MTKSIVRLALVGAAAASFVMPHAASASTAEPCGGTFVVDCVKRVVEEAVSVPCIPYGTFEICVTTAQ